MSEALRLSNSRVDRFELWLPGIVAVSVLVLHCAIFWAFGVDGYFVKYNLAAQQYLDSDLPSIRLMDLSPLYFLFSLLAERMAPGEALALTQVDWAQRVLVAGSAGLFFSLLRSRFPRRWSLAGVLIFALEPHVLVYERIFEPEVLLVFCLLGSIAAVERRSLASAFIAGGFAACSIATRPTFLLLFIVLAPVFYAWRGERGRALSLRSAAFLLPVLLCGLLLGLRAERITGDWASPVMNPGTVFFEGNHPLSRGTSAVYPPIVASLIVRETGVPDEAHIHYRQVASEALQRNLSVAEVNAYWAGKAFAFIRDEPRHALGNLAEKSARVLSDYRWHDVGTAERFEAALPTLPGFFAAICALALIGFCWELPRLQVNLFFYAYSLVQFAVMLVFYVSARQQMVMVAPLVFFAIAGLRAAIGSVARAGLAAVVFTLVFAILMSSNDVIFDSMHRAAGGARAAAIAEEVQGLGSSILLASRPESFAQVLASASWLAEENAPGNIGQEPESLQMSAVRILRDKENRDFFDEFDLATLELKAGDLERAQTRFAALAATGRRPYRTYWEASDPLFYLGRIAALQNQPTQAAEYLLKALAQTPGDPFVLAELTVLGTVSGARELIERYYSSLDAHLLLGEAFLIHGRARSAIVELTKLLRKSPRVHRASVALAVAYGEVGDFETGVEIYRESLRISSTPVIFSDEVSNLHRRWAASHPENREIQLEAARVLYFHGRFQEALAMLSALDRGDTHDVELRDLIQKIRMTLSQIPSSS